MIISPDSLLPDGPTRWEQALVGEAFATCHRAIRDTHLHDPSIVAVGIIMGVPGAGKSTVAPRLDSPSSVLMEAVWASAGHRKGFAERVKAARRTAVCWWVRTPLEVCRERNNARSEWRRVPDSVLVAAHRAIEKDRPTRREGWTVVEIIDGVEGR